MKPSLVQLTLRRWAEIVTSSRFYLYFLGFVVIGSVLGPYGTFDQVPLLQRISLSIQLNMICWGLGILIATPVRLVLQRLQIPPVGTVILAGMIASMAIIPALAFALNYHVGVTFSQTQYVEHTVLFTALVILVSLAIIGARGLKNGTPDRPQNDDREKQAFDFSSATPRDPNRCPLQQRLPKEKRGILYAMVAQDHYVEMITDKGSELVLMRLSDAAEQANPKYGMRIHRSAWISIFGVAELDKRGRQSLVKLRNGRELPVSRSSEQDLHTFFKTASDEETLVAI